MKVKRYKIYAAYRYGHSIFYPHPIEGSTTCEIEAKDGEYVKYADYAYIRDFLILTLCTLVAIIILCLPGCGSLERAIENTEPVISIVNYVPGSGPEICADCPGLYMADLYAAEIDAGTWALAAANTADICIDNDTIKYARVDLWEENAGGEWAIINFMPLNSGSYCFGRFTVWPELPYFCPGESWCNVSGPWVSLSIELHNGYRWQGFTEPGPLPF
jgi:hypothetical protein